MASRDPERQYDPYIPNNDAAAAGGAHAQSGAPRTATAVLQSVSYFSVLY